jgi:3D (Asp-Asp-Asp) domain-containing protein
MGDAVVFPAEITTKAGSDFDIDKMNLYLKNWYQDFDGNAKEIKWQGNEEKTKEYIRDIVGKGLFLTLEEKDRAKEWIDMAVPAQVTLELSEQDEDTPLILIANKVKSVFALADDITYSEALRFFIETEDLMETQVQELYMKALENRYLDALIRVITLPRNFEKLTTPNTQEFFSDGSPGLKEIAKKIKRLTTPKNKQTNIERNTNTDHARLLRSSYMTETRHNFVIGKEGVGVGAVSNTNLSVNQVSRIIIPFDTKIKVKGRGEMTVSDLGFNFNEIIIDGKKYISLSGVYDKLGKIQ